MNLDVQMRDGENHTIHSSNQDIYKYYNNNKYGSCL